jgi:hypothetical protein
MAWVSACTYDADATSSDSARFRLVESVPTAGDIAVCRACNIDLAFNIPPAAETAIARNIRIFTGLYEVFGDLKTDLIERRVRFTPAAPMRPNLRHQVFLHEDLQGVDGARLGEHLIFDFTTGTHDRTPWEPPPNGSSASALSTWTEAGCQRGGCHRSPNPPAGVDLSSAQAMRRSLVNIPAGPSGQTRIVPGDHARSYLMLKLLGEGGTVGFSMPPGGPRLPRSRLRQVADWIDAGATLK